MNGKNILKILSISLAVIVLILGGLLFWGLSKLPSAFDIKQSLTPPALKKSSVASASQTAAAVENKEAATEEVDTNQTEANPAQQASTPKEKLASDTAKVLLEDFADPRKPMIEGCRNLAQASESHFLRDPENASAKYFFESLAQDKKDPLVETAAPILRYIFRAPGMQSVVEMIMKAEETKDVGILKKAEFYYEIYRAGDFLKDHKDDMDVILQKTYNLHHLAKAVAQKPALAKDAATLTFCEDMEKNVTDDGVYNADEASKEMLKFLGDAGIDPKSIGYDPNYRSKVKLNLSNSQVTINDTWVVKLFAKDIQKAQKEPTAKN
ncbi:hypothetical protein [uncultured Bdellovibrio sp.]|uniref:hypothetical protein n=1 Tax=Bdellovibrio sp. HCB-162 TaxID=3394234 RepID=UPI0025D7AC5B|nr:hypothetical protein [uncultured Bdellovibrio sp.]